MLYPNRGGRMRPLPFRIALVLNFLLIALSFPPAAPAAEDIGKVIMFTPGATVLRDGKTKALAMHAGIRTTDTLQTDASGRVKILFNDDSSVSLGPNTTMDMNEYADAGSKPAFGVHVPQGVIRVITGKITEQNPDGFKLTTPEVTVGIRGTIISLRTGRGVTTVYVENTLRQVYVNNIRVPSGSKITLPGSPRPEAIQPEDRRQLGRDLAFLGGAGVAAAAPEAAREDGRRLPAEYATAGPEHLLPPDTALKTLALGTQGLGDTLATSPTTNPGSTGSLTGHVLGSLSSTQNILGTGLSGSFGFDVNLLSGMISNGIFSLSGNAPSAWSVNLSGGAGSASPTGFTMNMPPSTSTTQIINGVPSSGVSAAVNGSANLLSVPSGTSFPVTYTVHIPPPTSLPIDSGTGTGTITKH